MAKVLPQDNWIQQSHQLLRLFYLLVLFDFATSTLNMLYSLWVKPVAVVEYPKTLIFLSWIPENISIPVFIVGGGVCALTTFLHPEIYFLRFGNMLMFLLSKGFIFSHARFAHHYWPMLIALVFLCACPPLKNKKNWQEGFATFSYLKMALVLFYFLPAILKIGSTLQSGDFLNANYLLVHGKESLMGSFMIDGGRRTTVLYWGAVLIQFSTGLLVWKPGWHQFTGFLILFFHAISLLVFSVNFFMAGIVFFLFFYFTPQVSKEELQ